MLIILYIHAAVISLSTAFLQPDNITEFIPCERGWYYFGENCYKVGGRNQHVKVSWSTALERCKSYRADLVSISSQEEQDFLYSFLNTDQQAWVWIGLSDRDEEGVFKWSDGSVLDYTNWAVNEPNGGIKENCVHMWFDPGYQFTSQWNDLNCDTTVRQYICKMKSNSRKRSPNPLFCSSEGNKGWKWEGSCYHYVKQKKSWLDAENHCKNYYKGHLVSILDKLEDLALEKILDSMQEDLWIGIKVEVEPQQKWTSGWYVSYDGFEKEIIFKKGTCVARRKRQEWITVPCSRKLQFVCKVSKETPPVLKAPEKSSYCPERFDGWRDLGGEYCYYFETEKTANFYEALFECKRREGNLLSLHSKEETDVVLPFVKLRPLSKTFYIGLVRGWPREEEFSWTDGSAVDYVNWRQKQPNNILEKCVEVYTHEVGQLYTWNDVDCTEKKGYICAAKKILENAPIENEDTCKATPKSSLVKKDACAISTFSTTPVEESCCTSHLSLIDLIAVFGLIILDKMVLVIVVYYFRLFGTENRKKSTAASITAISPSTDYPSYMPKEEVT